MFFLNGSNLFIWDHSCYLHHAVTLDVGGMMQVPSIARIVYVFVRDSVDVLKLTRHQLSISASIRRELWRVGEGNSARVMV